MSSINLSELALKINRLGKKFDIKEGSGYEYVSKIGDKEVKYGLHNIKDLDDWEDDIHNMFKWLWALKDYLKNKLRDENKRPQLIEDFVNNNFELQLCADIANGLKHSKLTSSRTGLYPKLQKPGLRAPQKSIEEILFIPGEVHAFFKNQEFVKFHAFIVDQSGNQLGEATETLNTCIELFNDFGTN